MADSQETVEQLGTFVLGQLGRTAVVLGDVRDIAENIGKTVEVHADGEVKRVKLTSQWQSARHGGTFFPLYRETGEVKRDGSPKRERTAYRIGGAHVSANVNAEPMTFDDAMLFLNSASDVPETAPKPRKPRNAKGNSSDSSDSSPNDIATTVAMLIAGGMSPSDAAAVGIAMRQEQDSAKGNSSPKPRNAKGNSSPKPRNSSPKPRNAKGNSSDSVEDMLSEL